MQTCQFVKQNGQPCHAKPLVGDDRCFFHSPKSAAKRASAQKRGGKNKPHGCLPDADEITIETTADVITLAARVMTFVLRGELDPRRAQSIASLLTLAKQSIWQDKIEIELAALKAAQKSPAEVAAMMLKEHSNGK